MTSPSVRDQHGSVLATEPAHTHPQNLSSHSREATFLPDGWALYAVQVVVLAAVYFGAAKVGLTMAFVAEQVTAVWPPTGIALAAFLFLGYRVWPGIALGAFLTNATASAPLGAAAGIALGNTLEALLGAWLLRHLVQFDHALGRIKDVLGLVVLAATLSTMVSATIGVASLCAGGVRPWAAYPEMWSVWWLGDALGDLVVAPLLLTWAGWRHIPWRPRQVAEVVVLMVALVAVSLSVFAGPFSLLSHPARAYTVFPFVTWAALRFGPTPATLATAIASCLATWGTVHGYGPFRGSSTNESLILLQVFMAVVAITTLLLAAVVTERARAEEFFRQSYNLMRAVTDGTTDAVYVKDCQGRYLMINPAGAAFLGKTVAEVIGQDDTELFTPTTAQAIMEGDRRVMATGDFQTFEDIGTALGVTRTYLSTKGPYRNAQGTILGVVGISRDITERKQAEERFRLVVESAPNGLVMINTEGRIILVNEQAEKLFGYRRAELLGQLVEVLLPDRFRGKHSGQRAEFFAHPARRVMGSGREVYGRRRDGSEFPVEIGLAPIETPEGPAVLSVIVDITDRRRAEELRARLAAIVESSEDAMFSKDLDGIIVTWNRAAEKLYGYSAAEIVGQPISVLFPPERAGEVSAVLEKLTRGERLEHHETIRRRKDGTRIDISLNTSPIKDTSGRITGSSVMARDITSRKCAERRLAAEQAVTRALAESSNLEDATLRVLHVVGETLDCDLAAYWEVGFTPEALHCVAVWHPSGNTLTAFEEHYREIAFARGEGLTGLAWDSGQPAWVAEAAFPRSVVEQRKSPCGALAFPLRSNGNVLGVIELFSVELQQLQEAELVMMASIGVQIGQFIERRHAEAALHAREREFGLARKIQQGLLPKAPPNLRGLAIAGTSLAAQETGGDYYDFIPMSDGDHGIAVGDASGHGIGAALLIAATRAYLRALALSHTDPGTILRLLNNRLTEDISSDHFVTLLFARLCPATRSLVYSSAGHWPGYVFNSQGEVKLVLDSTSLPLGVDPNGDFSNGATIALDAGDLVLFLSDGVIEASSVAGEQFGVTRVVELIRAHRDGIPGKIVAALLHQIREWSPGAHADDMTAVVIKVEE